ncbi:MAG TPA: 3-dehydroquinate synthase [Bacilli bacterium]
MKELLVDLQERSYPIYIGDGLLNDAASYLQKHGVSKQSPVMVVTDTNVAPLYLDRLGGLLQSAGYTVVPAIVSAGETAKSLDMLEELVTKALSGGLDRKSTIIALGGGVVGDLAGFAAASYMRGISFVQMPTTILAHDSSVGGKVGVNHRLAKNIIGAFHQPKFVLYDTSTLRSLPLRHIRAGLAEVIKHGFIRDAEFAAWCEEHADALLRLDPHALQHALYEGCKIKAQVVAQDEKEAGLRAILNLGHTIGHALEAVAGYGELLHGEAISIGMIGAAKLAVRLGRPEAIYRDMKRVLQRFGLPTALSPHYQIEAIMSAMMHDKKFKEGVITFIVPVRIGEVEINKHISAQTIREIVAELQRED